MRYRLVCGGLRRREGEGVSIAAIVDPIADDLAQVEGLLAGVAQVDYEALAAPLRHVLQGQGKRLRPALLLLAAKLYRYEPRRLLPAAAAVELLHTATLVHDDLIDNSPVRRGQPTLNTFISSGATVLVGDYLFAHAAAFAAATGSLKVMEVFSRLLKTICQGELRQIFSAGDWQQTPADYYRKISSKTAALFAAATEIGAILSHAPSPAKAALHNYGYHLGLAFQIVDDILDFVGDEEQMGKPVGSDLRQGNLTLPALYCLWERPQDNPIRRLLAGDGDLEENVAEAVRLVRSSSAIAASYREASAQATQAQESLRPLPNNPSRSLLHSLADYVVQRRY